MFFIFVLVIAIFGIITGFVILGYYKAKGTEYYYFRKFNNWKAKNKKSGIK